MQETHPRAIHGTEGQAIHGADAQAIHGTQAQAIHGADAQAIHGTQGQAIHGADAHPIHEADAQAIHEADAQAIHATAAGDERLAGAPISWGACELPGWGVMPAPDTVLSEMAQLGLRGTELGPPGFLPDDPAALAALLERYGLALVGGFVPLVLHERGLDSALDEAHRTARLISGAGGGLLVLAAVQDAGWGAPQELDALGWNRLATHLSTIESLAGDYGLGVALHPHAGTLIETSEQVQRALEVVEVGWCLDTGHLLIGGSDPVQFAREHGDRVVHVHLKDVDAGLAAELRAGRRSLVSATREGLFKALGQGDARIAEVMDALQGHGYNGWLVLEQDTAITGDEPTVAGGPMRDARASIAFLHHTALRTEEINR